jgi:hypothetical protein
LAVPPMGALLNCGAAIFCSHHKLWGKWLDEFQRIFRF